VLQVEAGDREIKERRRHLVVPIAPKGSPADYVPFYFAPRSPMLFRINKGQVATYAEGQQFLIYFVTTVEKIINAELTYVYSDGNCANDVTTYYASIDGIEEHVDWEVMKATNWANTAEDVDRMRRRMAEFLVHREVPLDTFVGIATFDDEIRNQVQNQFQQHGREIYIAARREWYF
jgi:hypothetical protein